MTREEAKEELIASVWEDKGMRGNYRLKKVIEMAIEALEQPKVIKCGECKFFDTPECAMSGSCDGCGLEYDNGFDETGFYYYGERKGKDE